MAAALQGGLASRDDRNGERLAGRGEPAPSAGSRQAYRTATAEGRTRGPAEPGRVEAGGRRLVGVGEVGGEG